MMRISFFTWQSSELFSMLRHLGPAGIVQGNAHCDRRPLTRKRFEIIAATKQAHAFRGTDQAEPPPSPAIGESRPAHDPPPIILDHNLNAALLPLDGHSRLSGFGVLDNVRNALLNDAEDVYFCF